MNIQFSYNKVKRVYFTSSILCNASANLKNSSDQQFAARMLRPAYFANPLTSYAGSNWFWLVYREPALRSRLVTLAGKRVLTFFRFMPINAASALTAKFYQRNQLTSSAELLRSSNQLKPATLVSWLGRAGCNRFCKYPLIGYGHKVKVSPILQYVVPKRSSEQEKDSDSESNALLSKSGEPRTIVITSGKGGVGKTTTTANLGMSIARLGYRVALIDADIGLRNLDLLLGLENRVLYTAMDIFEGECRLDQALIRDKRLKNLSLLAISKNRQRYNVTRQKMDHLVSSISALGYHFILIDCPAGIDVGFINAISPAQEALIVTTPEITAMRDADRVAGLLEANGIYNAKLLINRVRPDMIQRHDMMSVQDVQDVLGIPLLGAIPEDLHVIISTNRGEPLVLRKELTLSGIAFENAARRLIGKQDYLIDLNSPYKNFFHKFMKTFFDSRS